MYKFFMPAKVLIGTNCIKENASRLKSLGRKALLVTGKISGKASGAMQDMIDALHEQGIKSEIFDRVRNNPSLENVVEGGRAARDCGADFIIGIGGGSPLDAAKAVAVLAVNNIQPVDLYKNQWPNPALPIAAVPTTAGTGSEVTPYSILTRDDLQTKMSFGNDSTFPRIAFLDGRYTMGLPYDVTVNTAIDAFTHAMEGYLSNRSSPAGDYIALESIRLFGEAVPELEKYRIGRNSVDKGSIDKSSMDKGSMDKGSMAIEGVGGTVPEQEKYGGEKYVIDLSVREKLLFMSMLGGMVISHTGTTIIHGMGYSLTYFKGIPHGKANAVFIREYLKFNYPYNTAKIDKVISALGMASINELGECVSHLIKTGVHEIDTLFTDEELRLYASQTMKQRSTATNIRPVSEEDIYYIMKASLGIKLFS